MLFCMRTWRDALIMSGHWVLRTCCLQTLLVNSWSWLQHRNINVENNQTITLHYDIQWSIPSKTCPLRKWWPFASHKNSLQRLDALTFWKHTIPLAYTIQKHLKHFNFHPKWTKTDVIVKQNEANGPSDFSDGSRHWVKCIWSLSPRLSSPRQSSRSRLSSSSVLKITLLKTIRCVIRDGASSKILRDLFFFFSGPFKLAWWKL